MGHKAILTLAAILALLVSSATAQPPPAPILPPSPAPAPAPHYVNLTQLLSVAGPFQTFLNYLVQTRVIETLQNQANDTKQGVTIFVPKDMDFKLLNKSDLADLTQDQLKTVLLYHAFPKYYSLSDFSRVSNPVSTFAGGQNTLNVTDESGSIRVFSSWATTKITSSVFSTAPVAIYQVDRVLLPASIFSTEPSLVPTPAPAPAPEARKPSDLAPSKSASSSDTKSSQTDSASSSHSIALGLFSYFTLALSGVLVFMF